MYASSDVNIVMTMFFRAILPTFCHLRPKSSMVRASHRRSEGCGFQVPLGNSDIYLSKKARRKLLTLITTTICNTVRPQLNSDRLNPTATIMDKIVGTLSNLMSKFHVPFKNVVHPAPSPPTQCSNWWKNLPTCLAQHWFGGRRGMTPVNASKEEWFGSSS